MTLKSKLDYPMVPMGEFHTLDCCVMALYERTNLNYEVNTLMNELTRLVPGYEKHIEELGKIWADQGLLN